MKRLFLFTAIIISASYSYSQNLVDALRYSQSFSGGTARSTAMGGAFGSLGGDFSSVSINPAGLGMYSSSEFTFTPEVHIKKVTTRYNGNEVDESNSTFNFNNLGYVGHFKIDETGFVGGSIGIGFNRLNNFNRDFTIHGDNPTSSLGDAIAVSANSGASGAKQVDDLNEFSERLFYEGYIFDYIDAEERYILSDAYFYDDGTFRPTEQLKAVNESGRINEWVVAGGFNYGHFFYFGASFSYLPIRYEITSSHEEYDANERTFQYFDFYETIKVKGNGFSAKFGTILRPLPLFRIGASIHLPVTYTLYEEFSASLLSYISDNPGTVYYPYGSNNLEMFEHKYKIITPMKLVGSAGLTLGKIAILSADLEYIDYTSMKLQSKDSDYDFSTENEEIRAVYRDNINLKTGTELRFGTLRLRGGLAYYGSPFKKQEENHDSYNLSYSAGFGFREKDFFFDLTYVLNMNEERYYMYSYDEYTKANIDTKTHRVLATIGFRF